MSSRRGRRVRAGLIGVVARASTAWVDRDDLVGERLAGDEASDVGRAAVDGARHAVSARTAQVRGHDDLRQVGERIDAIGLALDDVDPGPREMPALDRVPQGRRVDQTAPPGVDEVAPFWHRSELHGADHPLRVGCQRDMQADDGGGAQKGVQWKMPGTEPLPCFGDRSACVVHDPRAERGDPLAHCLADATHPDESDRGVREVVDPSGEHRTRREPTGPRLDLAGLEALQQGQHQHGRVLGGARGVDAGVVGDRDARRRGRVKVDGVDPGADLLDESSRGRQTHHVGIDGSAGVHEDDRVGREAGEFVGLEGGDGRDLDAVRELRDEPRYQQGQGWVDEQDLGGGWGSHLGYRLTTPAAPPGRRVTEYIEIRGARENNLKDVDLRIPKRQITIFTGVSGSGKSSVVFDTIATEAQRQLFENFSFFVRNFLPSYPQPQADSIENLSMAVIVDQKRLGGGSHSTVGTVTDIYTVLRLLFSRIGKPSAGHANAFSFNNPQGMCLDCNGLGRKIGVKSDDFLDLTKSLNEGAVQVPTFVGWEIGAYAASGFFDNDKKLADYTPEEMDLLLYGKDRKYKLPVGDKTMNATYLGVIEKFERAYIRRDLKTLSERTQRTVEPYLTMRPCPTCKGARLNQAALKSRINGYSIADMTAMEVGDLIPVLRLLEEGDVAAPMIATLIERLRHMADIGLDYLSLDRATDTLSGGESQRIKMVKHLGSSLVDVMYILDEPSIGLHARDVHRLTELLVKLRDKGNTVIVVEHDPDVMRVADHLIDMGPAAGSAGGEVVFEGSFADLRHADTLTGRFLDRALPLKRQTRTPAGWIPIRGARENNLRGIDVDIPTEVLTVVTGVAGSGKSSLIDGVFLPAHPDAIVIDQSAVGANPRSNPATYTGVMDDLRKAFAAANKVDAGLFSFNSKGACETCNGTGAIYTDLAFLDGIKTPCDACGGQRFKEEVLRYTLDGRNVSEVLRLTVAEALEALHQKEIVRRLQAMSDVGLDYLTLGQPLSTLSGGECQRIKMASELHRKGSIYVLDEPTTGLHMSDTGHLLEMLDRLVDGGNTVIVIEHDLDVIRNADWIIDLGPEGGSRGGELLFSGTPTNLLDEERSLTAEYLRRTSADR